MRFKSIYLSCLSLLLMLPKAASAQLVPDTTLGTENSIVNPVNNLRQDINGGATRGTSLFHSFQEFNVNAGQSVFFNAPGANNIFTRVTGNNVSNIFGTLGVNGNANLFLINPNGIFFGQGARLDLGGSFNAITADNLLLGDGLEFSAINPQPLAANITVDFPIGFGFSNTNTGEITVLGTGQNLQPQVPGQLIAGRNTTQSLTVNPQQNLNLIGRNVTLDRGVITAEGGRINIAAVQTGTVLVEAEGQLDLAPVLSFGNVRLLNGSLIDVSSPANLPSIGNGSVIINGSTIELLNNSVILSQNQNPEAGGNIEIVAAQTFRAIGVTENRLRTGIYSETGGLNAAEGANISIRSPNVFLENAAITANTYSAAEGGSISIRTDNLQLSPDARISTLTTSTATGGEININSIGSGVVINNTAGIIASSTGLGEPGELSIENRIFITPEVPIQEVEDLEIESVTAIEEDNLTVSLLTRQTYPEYIDTLNRSCQPSEATEDSNQFGIKDVFPTKKFLEEGGSWQFDIFITTDDRSKKQENWQDVVVPNAVITAANGKRYLGLVCATKID